MPDEIERQAPPLPPSQRFVPTGIKIPVDPLLRIQGYRDLGRVRADVREAAVKAAADAENLIAAEACYRRIGIESRGDGHLRLQTGVTFHGKEFAKVLGDCREVLVFVLSLGEALDEQAINSVESSDFVGAIFLESAGWLGIERATRDLAEHLTRQLRAEGLRLTRRLGPGYFDWPLEEQEPFFGLLNDTSPPVRLLESCAMWPKKSRSGLYGLRPAG